MPLETQRVSVGVSTCLGDSENIEEKNFIPSDSTNLEKSNPPIIEEPQPDPISINKIENLTPLDSTYIEKSNPPSPVIKSIVFLYLL